MAVSRARSVERSRWGLAVEPLAGRFAVWFPNDVPACRGLAVAWLKRGASVSREPWNQACPPRLPRRSSRGGHVMAAVMIGVDPHKASHTAVVISAAGEPLGEVRVRA